MNKVIHIVGGGVNQIPLVQQAKKMGYSVLLTDMYKNPPAKKYSDFFVQVDTTDKHKTLIESIKYNICGIVTDATDVAVPTVSFIAEQLDLNAIPYTTALSCTNKIIMRNSLQNFKSNMPKYKFFNSLIGVEKYILKQKKEFIVKPINSQGSKGVYKLDKYDKIKIENAFQESYNQGILIEEYIDGEQYSVETILYNGKKVVNLVTKIEFFKNKNIAKRLLYLNDIDKKISNELELLNEQILSNLHLDNCITHAEYRVVNGTPYLIEIACRGGGAGISTIAIPYLLNINVQEFLIAVAVEKKIIFDIQKTKDLLCIEFFEFSCGDIEGFQIDNRIDDLVYSYMLDDYIKEIKEIKDSRDRYGSFVLTGRTVREINDKRKKVYDYIKPNYKEKK